MIDQTFGDRRFPPKWRSSISVFYHEPADLPETYCDRVVTYLKVVCSITGYQAGSELTAEALGDDPWHVEPRELGDRYHACYAAMLQVAVFAGQDNKRSIPLAEVPYIMDFEPKRRELYEAVSQSGEILGRSASTLNLRKSATTGETTEYASKIGAEVKGSYAAVSASVSAEHSWGGGTHLQEENVRTTDESREKRETYSATTSLTQMYELFTGYHLGSNRAMFYMLARPHAAEEKDQYTFVNGPRRLEGVQEVFLVVNRPKYQKRLCLDAVLETAHLFVPTASTPATGGGQLQTTYTLLESPPVTMFGYWNENKGSTGNTKDYEQVIFSLPAGCELDTSRPNPPQSFDVLDYGPLPPLTIDVPTGFSFDIQDDTFWRSIQSITGSVSGGQVSAKVTLRYGGGNWEPRFNARVRVFYRCPQTSTPSPETPGSVSNPPTMFLTARSVSACVKTANVEEAAAGSVAGVVAPAKMFANDQRERLLSWLGEHRILDDAEGDEPAMRTLSAQDPAAFRASVLDAIAAHGRAPIPDEWRPPAEWVAYESPIQVDAGLANPAVPAMSRIRTANDLSVRLGEKLRESLGSGRRYAARTVSFWQTDLALRQLAVAARAMPANHADNVAVASLAFPQRDALLAAFGEGLRIRDVAAFQPGMLARGLAIGIPEARQLLSDLLRIPGKDRESIPEAARISLRPAAADD
jgi:hypothetical protein